MVTAVVPGRGAREWRLVESMLNSAADAVRAVVTGATEEPVVRLPGGVEVRRPAGGPVHIRGRHYGLVVDPDDGQTTDMYLDTHGVVHLGTAGGTTFAPYVALAELFDAAGGDRLDPKRRLTLLKDFYQVVAGDTDYTASIVGACAVCSPAPPPATGLSRCGNCGTLFRGGAAQQSWETTYRDANGHYFLGLESIEVPNSAVLHHGYEDYEEWARVILGEHHFDDRARRIESVSGRSGGTSLDVGCATGQFAASMAGRGWRASGVDLSAYCVGRARELYPSVVFHHGTLADVPGRFDVISYLDVFEHLDDPRRELAAIGQALNPGGVLFLELPNQDSVDAEILGAQYLFDEHLYFYGPHTIELLLANCGFDVLDVSSEHDIYFRVDRVVGPDLGAELARDGRGERLLVTARAGRR